MSVPRGSRGWVVGVAISCFVAGVAIGLAMPRIRSAFAATNDAVPGHYHVVRWLVEHYDLSADQARKVEMVYSRWDAERRAILDRNVHQLPLPVISDLAKAKDLREQRVMAVLDEEQLQQFIADSDSVPVELGGSNSSKDD